MKVKYEIVGDYWLASGEGPMRKILAEGGSLREAKNNFVSQWGRQYEEMERHTAQALQHEED